MSDADPSAIDTASLTAEEGLAVDADDAEREAVVGDESTIEPISDLVLKGLAKTGGAVLREQTIEGRVGDWTTKAERLDRKSVV